MMPRLILADRELPLPALEPPDSLLFALDSALEIRQGITEGRILYSPQGLSAWLSGGSSAAENRLRQQKFEATKSLLKGRKLEAAETAFTEAYREYLLTNPMARASRIVAADRVNYGYQLVGLREEARSVVIS